MYGKIGLNMNTWNRTREDIDVTARGAAALNKTTTSERDVHEAPINADNESLLLKIWNKLSKLDAIEEKLSKIDAIEERLNTALTTIQVLEEKTRNLETTTDQIKQSVEYNDQAISDMMRDKADNSRIEKLEEQITALNVKMVDYSNRMRRNNIVIHNLPEGLEFDKPDASQSNDDNGDGNNTSETTVKTNATAAAAPTQSMERFVESFLLKEVGVKVEIDAAHRTRSSQQGMPRLIHARCLRREDRDKVLKAAPAQLRNKKFKNNSVFLTDDLDPVTRETHKKLLPKLKEFREKDYFAFIPWSVPRVIRFKRGPKNSDLPLETFRG